MREISLKTTGALNLLSLALIVLTISLAFLSPGIERALYALATVILFAASVRWSNIYSAVLRLNSRLTQYISGSGEKFEKFEQRLSNCEAEMQGVNLNLAELERKLDQKIVQPVFPAQVTSSPRLKVLNLALLVIGIGALGFGLGMISREESNQVELQSALKKAKAKSQYAASQARVARQESRAFLRRIRGESAPHSDSYTTIVLPKGDVLKFDEPNISSEITESGGRSEPYARWKFSDNAAPSSLEKTRYPEVGQSPLLPGFGFGKRNVDSSP